MNLKAMIIMVNAVTASTLLAGRPILNGGALVPAQVTSLPTNARIIVNPTQLAARDPQEILFGEPTPGTDECVYYDPLYCFLLQVGTPFNPGRRDVKAETVLPLQSAHKGLPSTYARRNVEAEVVTNPVTTLATSQYPAVTTYWVDSVMPYGVHKGVPVTYTQTFATTALGQLGAAQSGSIGLGEHANEKPIDRLADGAAKRDHEHDHDNSTAVNHDNHPAGSAAARSAGGVGVVKILLVAGVLGAVVMAMN